MSRICQVTGKRVMIGNNVSHSKRRTKRTFLPNLFDKKYFLPEENRWISLKISASGIRLINKKGLTTVLKEAKEKGFIANY
jgi:large subunit ribosomal protein L28